MEESYEGKRVLQDFGVVEFGLMPLCHQVSGVWIDVRGVGLVWQVQSRQRYHL